MSTQTLAERTPADSPFAILYRHRATPDTSKPPGKPGPKSKAKPAREVMQAAVNRANPYSNVATSTRDNDKTANLQKAAI